MHMETRMALVIAAACSAWACGDPVDDPAGPGGSSGGSSGGASDGGSSTTDGATPDGGSTTGKCADAQAPVPSEPAAMNAWLQTRVYECWAGESGPHSSAGPHGNVRTFLNDVLDSSMAGDGEHPAGSAAVKELYGSDASSVTGWAVSVKTEASSANGQGWYWYEVFSTEPGASAAFSSHGEPLCANCHAGGKDFVLIPHPLQ
jgi:hypothetical protein